VIATTTDFKPRVVPYDLERFDLPHIVAEIMHHDLQTLDGSKYDMLTRGSDQSTVYHSMFYQEFEEKLGALYREFASHMGQLIFPDRDIHHQRTPTFRVQFPNNVAVGEMHTDSDYSHQDGEINFWVPLTPVWGSNTVWVERTRGGYNYQPWTLKPGQVLVFDSVNWRHGNIRNGTGCVRVSFDFRLIPAEKYADSGASSVNAGRRMCLGEYWEAADPPHPIERLEL
jgi:ectoine hydroxylase-related dioxygenase (phytanoyl-CoA dioxygenase family)